MVENRDLSIIIRCSDDWQVFRCIESIDEPVEIIVSLTKNKKLEQALTKRGIKWVIAPKGNLSLTSNIGFSISTKNYILVIDSDTYFMPGAIRALISELEKHPVVRMNVLFDKGKSFNTKISANARRFVFQLPLAFTPGLAIRRSVIDTYLMGYFFNNTIPFAVDSDVNLRLFLADVPIKVAKKARLIHGITPLFHDLKCAIRIGQGVFRIALYYKKKLNTPYHKSLWILKAVKPPHWGFIIKHYGIIQLFYQWAWDILFWFGFSKEGINILRRQGRYEFN